jgi:hypothetical protein
MEPLVGTFIIVTGDHIPMANCTTGTVDLRIFISLVLVIIIHIFVRTGAITLIRVRGIRTAEHRIVILIALSMRGLLRRLDATTCTGRTLERLAMVRFEFLDLMVGRDLLGQCFLDADAGARAGAACTATCRGAGLWCTRTKR